MQIEAVPFSAAHVFARIAARERVSISDTSNTEWFAGVEDGRIMAVAGLIKTSTGYRIKGVYVVSDYRGKGHGATLTKHLMTLCEARCADIEVFAYNAPFYESQGFKRFGVLPNGAVKLRRRY